jgi:hypothetical protein
MFGMNLDRLRPSKTPFTRSTSFQSSLRHSKTNKIEDKISRTKSTSPIKTTDTTFKRSKSNKTSSSSLLIPLINQCIQSDRTPIHMKPPKRSPPPLPPKTSPSISNHIYDSLQDSPILTYEEKRTVSTSNLPPTRVTEL